MAYIPVPDMAGQLSPNISFKTEGDRAAIVGILQGEYSEVVKFNQAPARKALEFADKLDSMASQKLKATQIAQSSLVFENRELSEEEKQELIKKHFETIKGINNDNTVKSKLPNKLKTGERPERVPFRVDGSQSQFVPADVVSTGRVRNIIQAKADKQGPQKGHWAKDKNGKPVYKGGKRLWIEGQHNYNRQRDPRNPDEAILGTRLMNNNMKLEVCKDGEKFIDEIDLDARIVKVGIERKVHDRSTQDEIIAPALKEAAEIIRRKFSAAYQMVPKAESIQSLVTEEDHK